MQEGADRLVGMPVVVLGAGRGRRMGGSKALMLVQGRPWWAVQDERLRAYGLGPLWVVSAAVLGRMEETAGKEDGVGDQGSALVGAGMGFKAVVADEAAPMFISVLVGLAACNDLMTRGVFVLPVDTPVPRLEHWVTLVGSSIPAHPTHKGKGGHPLYLPGDWIERELGALLERVHAEGMAAVSEQAHTLRLDRMIQGKSLRFEVDDPGVVVNMNEPTDLDDWLDERGEEEKDKE